MKIVLYLVIILAASAIAKYLLGDRKKPQTVSELGLRRLSIPNLEKFTAWLIDRACAQCGEGIRNDPLATTRLRETAEKAFLEIEESGKSEINLPFLTADQSGPKHFAITIDGNQLREMA